MMTMDEFLARSASQHDHLCPRQVLGVRMGMTAGGLFGIDLPRDDKRLLAISETDGCFVDGVSVVTNCTVGHRTLRIEDFGKIAVTFVDTKSGKTLRVVPRPGIRESARAFAPPERTKWEAYLLGYQRMPDEALFAIQPVELTMPVTEIVSRPGVRTTCARCGEEIMNGREVTEGGLPYCRHCFSGGYYRLAHASREVNSEGVLSQS